MVAGCRDSAGAVDFGRPTSASLPFSILSKPEFQKFCAMLRGDSYTVPERQDETTTLSAGRLAAGTAVDESCVVVGVLCLGNGVGLCALLAAGLGGQVGGCALGVGWMSVADVAAVVHCDCGGDVWDGAARRLSGGALPSRRFKDAALPSPPPCCWPTMVAGVV